MKTLHHKVCVFLYYHQQYINSLLFRFLLYSSASLVNLIMILTFAMVSYISSRIQVVATFITAWRIKKYNCNIIAPTTYEYFSTQVIYATLVAYQDLSLWVLLLTYDEGIKMKKMWWVFLQAIWYSWNFWLTALSSPFLDAEFYPALFRLLSRCLT
jgi:hypothetical protein